MLYNFLHYSSFVINGSMLQEALRRFHEWCSRNHDLHRFAHHPDIWWLGLKSIFYKKGLLKSEISLHKTWFMQGNFVQILWSTPFAKSFLIKNGLYFIHFFVCFVSSKIDTQCKWEPSNSISFIWQKAFI